MRPTTRTTRKMISVGQSLLRTGRKYAVRTLFSSAFLACLMSMQPLACAQEDLNGSDPTITSAQFGTAYTNSNVSDVSVITINGLTNGTRYTYSGALTGNIKLDITHQPYTNNENRMFLTGANSFTGGVTFHGGILQMTPTEVTNSLSGGLTLDNGVFMTNGNGVYNFDLVVGSGANWGAIRPSGTSVEFSGNISGGNFVVATDAPLLLSGAQKTYTGTTSIGSVKGGNNANATLKLASSDLLPATTVIEIGKSSAGMGTNNSTGSTLNLNGTTQTVAGLSGTGVLTGAGILNINMTGGASHEFSGQFNSAGTINLSGAGSMTIAGDLNASATTMNLSNGAELILAKTVNNTSLSYLKAGSGTTVTLTDNGVSQFISQNLTIESGATLNWNKASLQVKTLTIADATAIDLKGGDLTIVNNTPAEIAKYDIDNTDTANLSTFTVAPSAVLTNGVTFGKKITGNTRFVLDLYTNAENINRLVLSNAENSFTGGIEVQGGTLRVDNAAAFGGTTQIDFNGGAFMTNTNATLTDAYTFNLMAGGGALRVTGGERTVAAKITGEGSLEIINDNAIILTNTGNDYQGNTLVGVVGWRSDGLTNGATLKLGENEVLPNTTVVQLGGGAVTGTSKLDLNGTTETVAGLTGSDKALVSGAGILNINMAEGAIHEYSGQFTDAGTINLSGAGSMTIAGNLDASTTTMNLSNGAALTLAKTANNTALSNLTAGSGTTVTLTDNGFTQLVSGALVIESGATLNWNKASLQVNTLTIADAEGIIDLNGGDLTITNNTPAEITKYEISNTDTENLSTFTVAPSAVLTNGVTFGKKITGNTRFVLDLYTNTENINRLVLSNAENSFTGGIEVQGGTLRVDNAAAFGGTTQIDFNGGAFMTNTNATLTDAYTFNLMAGGGALRVTGGERTVAAKITGEGSLEIINDNVIILTNTGNDYQGNTLVGVVGWRNDALSSNATLKLGANEVLPNTTVVQLGGGAVTGTSKLDLNGTTETVAGLTGSAKGLVSGTGKLIINDTAESNLTYSGGIDTNSTVAKTGAGTWTLKSAPALITGTIEQSGGTMVFDNDYSSATGTVNLTGGTLLLNREAKLTPNTKVTGNATIVVPIDDTGYERQLFTSTGTTVDEFYQYAGDITNPQLMANIDAIANTAYGTGAYSADIWGLKTGDQSNTNVLQATFVNSTDAPITLEFARKFHNDAKITITGSDGTVSTIDWATTPPGVINNLKSDVTTVTFNPGVDYEFDIRLTRYNRTIGANGGGVNNDTTNPIGLGVRVAGTEDAYSSLSLAHNSMLGFNTSGLMIKNASKTFDQDISVNAGAVLTMQNSGTAPVTYAGNFTAGDDGAGTIRFASTESTGTTYFGGTAAGDVQVASGMTFSTNDTDGTIVGNFSMETGAIYLINGLTGSLDVGSFSGNGTIEVDLDSLDWVNNYAGTYINVDGALDLTGTEIQMIADDLEAYKNHTVDIFDTTLTSEQFSAMAETILTANPGWSIVDGAFYYGAFVPGGNDKDVPEPATWLMLILGTGLMAWYMPRRQRRK